MTTPDSLERIRGHIATLMTAARPDWDIAGCIAALRNVNPAITVIDLGIAALRYAADATNTTPAHLADHSNRAWDTDWWPRCTTHPDQRARRTNGECASCYADRVEAARDAFTARPGRPIPPGIRQQLLAAIHATASRSTATHPDATERSAVNQPEVSQ